MGEERTRRVLGRYVLYDEIAAGGMAAVYVGRLVGPAGFSRTVAIKSLHAQFAKDPEFVAMFLDEARLAARIRHPNVVSTLDVVALNKELFLVMDYIQGESLSRLERTVWSRKESIPLPIVSSIVSEMLDGLHAAHEATDEHGEPLKIVHRDVSPHNVMVGRDGISRVLDFGVAKAAARIQTTRDGQVKGKFAYMAPEQITRREVDRRTDVFAASIVVWEALTGERLFAADDPAAVVARVMSDAIARPSEKVKGLPEVLDAIVMKGLSRDPDQRFATAEEMARAIEAIVPPARPAEVGKWVGGVAGTALAERAERIAEIESQSSDIGAPLSPGPAPAHVEATQATDLSSSAPVQSRRSRTRVAWVFVVPIVLIGLVVTAVLVLNGSRSTSVASAPSMVAPAPSQTATATASETIAPIVRSAPTESASATHEAPIATAHRVVPTTHTAPPAPTASKPDCTPPYTFDENGVKHFKKGCL